MQNIDLVYVLGSGSCWKNNELRFSLRSVQKNLMGVRKIFVVGEDPGFLTEEIIHIPHPDPLSQNADGNMALKILRACQEKNLSNDFLFMNDDFIINRPIHAAEIPYMHKEDMKTRGEKFWTSQFYRYRLRRTFDVLKERGLPTLQYDYHAPIIFNKHQFPKVMAQFDFQADIGYTFRSLYGNCLGLPAIPVTGHKVTIYGQYNIQQINRMVQMHTFVGYNDQGFNDSLKLWLWQNFPERSKYEASDCDDILIRISEWINSDRDYWKGVDIFCSMVRARNLQNLFLSRHTPQLEIKLTHKLQARIKNIL